MTLEVSPFLTHVKRENENMLKELKHSAKEMKGFMGKCKKCHGKSSVSPRSVPIYYNVDNENREIIVHNMPSYKCETCEDVVFNFTFFNKVEATVLKEVFYKLNKQEEIPKEVNYEDIKNI